MVEMGMSEYLVATNCQRTCSTQWLMRLVGQTRSVGRRLPALTAISFGGINSFRPVDNSIKLEDEN